MSRRRNQQRREAELVKCPLYVGHTELDINCQPHVGDSKWTTLHYATPELRKRQEKCYCETHCYERCEHYLSWKHFAWEDDG